MSLQERIGIFISGAASVFSEDVYVSHKATALNTHAQPSVWRETFLGAEMIS